jgi:16S rRNA (guanine(966)-N(2))-methyltransferase RsmD
VTQALFNILGPAEARSFLDLFAGSGRVGLEASPRGFSPVYFVELSRKNADDIEIRAGEGEKMVLRMDVRRSFAYFGNNDLVFDVIFADPPYCTGWTARMGSLESRLSGIIKGGGILVLEHSKREMPDPASWKGWSVSSRQYGETVLSIFRKQLKG